MGLREVLDILCCPQCGGPLTLDHEESALTCAACGLNYSHDGDLVNLNPRKARELESHEHCSRRPG